MITTLLCLYQTTYTHKNVRYFLFCYADSLPHALERFTADHGTMDTIKTQIRENGVIANLDDLIHLLRYKLKEVSEPVLKDYLIKSLNEVNQLKSLADNHQTVPYILCISI